MRNLSKPLCVALLMVGSMVASQQIAVAAPQFDSARIKGPNACAECHVELAKAWKGSRHAKSFSELPSSDKALAIAKKLNIKKIKTAKLCGSCHTTHQAWGDILLPIAGVSCESCHNPAADWIKVHNSYSGKKSNTESMQEAISRWQTAEAKGMIRPYAIRSWTRRCYECHVIDDEKLINQGGHPDDRRFELVAWSQGEVRHNLWYNRGLANPPADGDLLRKMFVTGLVLELEMSLRALAKARASGPYASRLAERIVASRKKIELLAGAFPGIPEMQTVANAVTSELLIFDNQIPLLAAADRVAELMEAMDLKDEIGEFERMDRFLPKPAAYRGQVFQPTIKAPATAGPAAK
ncbi:MAG: hypothetical protein HQ483_07970 [Rhodospirillales bacterium]|nr:hypothetical protein [Rhodospirillales bacterium]